MENLYFIDKKILYKGIGPIYFIELFNVSGNFDQFERYVYSTKLNISVEWVDPHLRPPPTQGSDMTL